MERDLRQGDLHCYFLLLQKASIYVLMEEATENNLFKELQIGANVVSLSSPIRWLI